MDSLFVILSIILYIIFSAMNRKAKAVQREAQKKAFQQTTAMGEATPPPMQTSHGTPRTASRRTVQAAPAPVPAARPVSARPVHTELAEGESAMVEERTPRMRVMGASTVTEPMQTMQSQLTEISASAGHTVEASNLSGHTHEETSLSGRFGDCTDPVPARRPVERAPSGTAAAPIFAFDANNVRSGLIYAEILGKPKALRGR